MNCLEVQKYFADLLDDSLDYERAREIDDHLTACSRCSEEIATLAECQRLVSGLPPVEPPLGFTTRVMAEVRAAAHRPTLRQRLFLPLQIKLPLQAMAAVLISVVAAFIYQKESRQRESATTAQPARSFQNQDETDKLPSSAAQGPAAESKMQVPDEAGAQAKGAPPPAPLRDSDSALKDATPAGESPASGDLREKRAASSLEALRSGTTLSSDHELTLRLKEPPRRDKTAAAPLELERSQAQPRPSTSQAEFKDLDQARQRAIKTGQPQTVWTTIAASQYDGFKNELAGLGNIESELPAPADKNDAKSADQLRIKVTILPPLSAAEPSTSQPAQR